MSDHYHAYINSNLWRAKRAAFLASGAPYSKDCYICRKPYKPGFHVHHLTYKHLGSEPFEDLVIACGSCHDIIHKLHDSRVATALHKDKRKAPSLKSSTNMARELFKQENVLSAKNGKTAKKQSRKQRGKAKRREPAKPKKTPPAPILTLIPGWKLTEQDIEAGRSERGGFGRKELAKFGVPYPPPKLWKQSLIEGRPLSPAMKRRFKGIWPEPTEEMASHYGIPLH